MKIVLIQPKTEGHNNFPPLGLGYLATVAVGHGHEVKIIDLEVEPISNNQLIAAVREFNPSLVGITSTIRSKKEALAIADMLSGFNIVFGGPQSTLEPEEYLRSTKNKSFVLKGESEKSLLKLADYLAGKISIKEVTNLAYLNDGVLVENDKEPVINVLDELPIVDRKLFNLPAYRSKLFRKKATNILTSRGCPFRCAFCFHDFHGKIYRQRSTKNVIDEILYLKNEFGYEGFIIYDDNFTVNRTRLEEICNYIIDNGLDIFWRCLSRVNVMDEEILRLMKRAGCKEIAFGVESSSQETLDRINKFITPEQSEKIMNLCRDIGIVSKAYVMIGFPWETKKMINDTIDFTCRILPYVAQFSVLTPLPNTAIYEETVEMGYEIENDFDFTRFTPCFETENFTKEEIVELQKYAENRLKRAQLVYALKHPFSHFAFYLMEGYLRALFYKTKSLVNSVRQ